MHRNPLRTFSLLCLISFLMLLTVGDALAVTIQEPAIAAVYLIGQEGDSRVLSLVLGLIVPVIILILWGLHDKRRQPNNLDDTNQPRKN